MNLSKAQNNSMRKILQIFEPILNRIIDSKLSPNEISLLGLNKSIHGLNKIFNSKNISVKFYGFYLFSFGEFLDLLDGIRARSQGKARSVKGKEKTHQKLYISPLTLNTLNGQLLDGFCDRVKEFYYFYKKTNFNKQFGISCILPSIARAANELLNQTVSEKDEKGGSMLDRTRLIFISLFFYILGFTKKSLQIDQIIYERNLATFSNRINKINFEKLEKYPPAGGEKDLNEFQKKALIRLKFYLKLYKEEQLVCHSEQGEEFQFIKKLDQLKILKSVNLKNEEKLFSLFNNFFPINKCYHSQ